MTTSCKEWQGPEGLFRPLCTNQLAPKLGVDSCFICVDPKLAYSIGCGGCAATEVVLPRSMNITVAAGSSGPTASIGNLDQYAWGSWYLSNAYTGMFDASASIYDSSTNTLAPISANWYPNTCNIMSSLPKMIEVEPGPAVHHWGLSAQIGGIIGTSFGQKSASSVTITISQVRYQAEPSLGANKYRVSPSLTVRFWQCVAEGPYPRCSSTFRAGASTAAYSGGNFGDSNTFSVTVNSAK